ncbi:hypothetical protein ZWY2020_013364 [Hordeum vulgare]|nr:hypothetical protein ZWY2020_013364 [Hordeum vulgare]
MGPGAHRIPSPRCFMGFKWYARVSRRPFAPSTRPAPCLLPPCVLRRRARTLRLRLLRCRDLLGPLRALATRSHGQGIFFEEVVGAAGVLAGGLAGSDVDAGLIDALRHHRLLPPASQVLVRLLGSEASPAPVAGEVVVFVEHFYRGFGLPASSFFAEWLQFFSPQPHHVASNAILQLAAFVVLCEGFVGIEPRVDLWCSLFFSKQQSIAMEKSEVEKLKGPSPMTPCGAALVHQRPKSGFPRCLCKTPSSIGRRGSSM